MPQPKTTDLRIIEAVRLIKSNYAQEFDFNALAETLNLSASRLRQLFKLQTGIPFRKYLQHVRMQRAQFLLETTFLKIKQITEQIGIRDDSHFVRDFAKEFGQSPAEYRKSYRSAKQKSAGGSLT